MILASVRMAKASFISAEQPLAPDLAADRAVLRTSRASRRRDIVFVVNPRGIYTRFIARSCFDLLKNECRLGRTVSLTVELFAI